jgi:ferredoxin--NADP+ reductase
MPVKVLTKRFLNDSKTVFEMSVDAPLIARKAQAGNFIIVRLDENGERIPLTIADYDRENGTITMVVLVIGKSTEALSLLNEGDSILDFVGPLGKAAELEKYENPVVIVGGGVGIAAAYPQAKEMKALGNYVISIIGARTSELLFWREKMQTVSDEMIITTDDGSEGVHGRVTDALKPLIEERPIDRVIAIGPLIMMKFVALLTSGNEDLPKVKTTVSLNPIMVDGTGMCGGCRYLTLDNQVKFACVEGPDVDAHNVDFNNLLRRNDRFKESEQLAREQYHQCLMAAKSLEEADACEDPDGGSQ